MTQLETYIAQFRDKTIAVAFHDFETGKEIYINADESFHPASTFKVHVMMEVFRQAEGDCYHWMTAFQLPIPLPASPMKAGSRY